MVVEVNGYNITPHAILRFADLTEANLSYADLTEANLKE